jgi:hypothetical protein
MEYSIVPSEDRKYIILTVKGEITREIAMQCNLEAHALGEELGIDRYLTDVTEARNNESVVEKYKFAYQDMQQHAGIDRRARVAMLVSPDDHSHDFVETVTRNSGLDVTLFRSREEATAHLMKD